jgi:hypothetical protein
MANGLKITSGSTSTDIERIRGGTQVRVAIIRVIGVILSIIAAGFIGLLAVHASEFQVHASGLLHLLTASVFALVGFVAGQKSKGQD